MKLPVIGNEEAAQARTPPEPETEPELPSGADRTRLLGAIDDTKALLRQAGTSPRAKQIRVALSVLEYTLFRRRKPVVVYLLATNHCQLRCKHCFPDIGNASHRDLGVEDWKRCIRELKQMGCRMITLIGGEPLVYKGIDEIVECIHEEGILCDMITNGLLIERKMDVVQKLDSMCVSIDGNMESNDLIRGKGTYKLIMKQLEIAKEANIDFRINMVLTRHNMKGGFDHLLEVATKYDTMLNVSLLGEMPKGTNFAPDDEEVRGFIDKMIELKKDGAPIANSLPSMRYAKSWPISFLDIGYEHNLPADFDYSDCFFKNIICYIDSNGAVYPCSTMWDRQGGLKFQEVGLQRAWDHLSTHGCVSCGHPNSVEWGLLFTHPETFVAGVKRVLTAW